MASAREWCGAGVALSLLIDLLGCGRAAAPPAAPAATPSLPWFADVTTELGIDFVYHSGGSGRYHLPEIMGGGVAAFDYDGDGDTDLYFTNGNDTLPGATASGSSRNRLFRQEGDGRFRDVTEAAGVGDGGYGMGVAVGDYDNDGAPDLFVANYGPDRLYRNRGDGTFADATAAAGVDIDGWSSSAAFVDYDRDGWLNLYVARYLEYDPAKRCFGPLGGHDYCGPKEFPPLADRLLHNRGDGTFEDVSERAGIAAARATGLGVVADDFNDDGYIDIYVANDGYANFLWINQKDGGFRDEAMVRGSAVSMHGAAQAGMGVIAADLDGDGDSDLFMTHLRNETNTMYRNQGGERGFIDASGTSGLGLPSLSFTGFGVAALDVELDGDLDVAVANGAVARKDEESGQPGVSPWDPYREASHLYLNAGRGTFGLASGQVFGLEAEPEISRGLVASDLDRDGDLDLVIANIEGRARVYKNQAPRQGHWLIVRAVDRQRRRTALGARVEVQAGGITRVGTAGGNASYLSASDGSVHFGLGAAAVIDALRVRWPDGRWETFTGGAADRVVVLEHGTGQVTP